MTTKSSSMMDYFTDIINYYPAIMITLGAVALLIVIAVVLLTTAAVKRAASKKAPQAPVAAPPKKSILDDEPVPESKMPPIGGRVTEALSLKGLFRVSDLSLSFLRAIKFLRERVDSEDYKYHIPWYLMVGATGSGKTTMLESSELEMPVGQPDFGIPDPHPGCQWWFFNRGIVLDIKGEYFIREVGRRSDEVGWRSLLALLARYRSKRPIDGLILVIPATELYGDLKLTQDEIGNRAKFLAEKLRAAQHGLGVRVPVYVTVTKCDAIRGFQSLCAEIPTANQTNMLGWTVPYSLSTAFTIDWIDDAFAFISASLKHLRLEIFAGGYVSDQADGVFLFPNELVSVKDPLSLYLQTIFQTSAYEESLILRGIYFTGDSGFSMEELFQKATLLNRESNDDDSSQLSPTTSPEIPKPANDSEPLLPPTITVGPPLRTGQEIASQTTTPTKSSSGLQGTSIAIAQPKQRKIFFVKDILFEKVFQETGLAQPVYNRLVTANHTLNIAKILMAVFVAVGTIGLLKSAEILSTNKSYMVPVLDKINYSLRQLELARGKGEADQIAQQFDGSTKQLLLMMDKVHNTTFFSFFMPPSWFSPLHEKLRGALKVSYEQIILRTLYMDMIKRGQTLIQTRPGPQDQSTSIAQVLQPTTMPEFKLLQRYVHGMIELALNVQEYNSLDEYSNADILGNLIQYAFQIPLPLEFKKNYRNFQELFETVSYPKIDINPFEKPAQDTLKFLYGNFIAAVFSTTSPTALLGRVNTVMKQFTHQYGGALPQVEVLRKFSFDVDTAIKAIGEEGKTWLDGKYFNPGPQFQELISDIGSFQYFGKDIVNSLASSTAYMFTNFQVSLGALNRSLTEHPVLPSKKPKFLSAGIFQLQRSLSKLFDEPFMAPPKDVMFLTSIPPNKVMYWDNKLIQMAVSLGQRYQEFSTKDINDFPPLLQETLRLVAKATMQANMATFIAQAQTLVDSPLKLDAAMAAEDILRSKIAEINQIIPNFLELLQILSQDQVGTTFVQLRKLLGQQMYMMLNSINEVFDEYAPYTIGGSDFEWWNGQVGASLQAFGVSDDQDLKSYLQIQRQRIQFWSDQYAKGIVGFLSSEVMRGAVGNQNLLQKWQRIIKTVDQYDKGQPGNGLKSLETFLTTRMNMVTLKNCFAQLSLKEAQQTSGDFFTAKKIFFERGMLSRCEIMRRQNAIKDYQELVNVFNTSLKGKYPFTAATDTTAHLDAQPGDILHFFNLYQEFGGNAQTVLDQIYQLGDIAQQSMEFLVAMDKVRDFFDAYLKQGGATAPTFDLTVDFRLNKSRENGANMIIEWYVQPETGSRIQDFDKVKAGLWQYGNPISVGFRWSDNAPNKPVADKAQPNLQIEGQDTAVVKYGGGWSLLRLIKGQQAESIDVNSMSDKSPYVLKFTVPVQGGSPAILFDRIILREPSTGQGLGRVLTIPEFPSQAPGLNPKIIALQNTAILVKGSLHEEQSEAESETFAVNQSMEAIAGEEVAAGGVQVPTETSEPFGKAPTTQKNANANAPVPPSTRSESHNTGPIIPTGPVTYINRGQGPAASPQNSSQTPQQLQNTAQNTTQPQHNQTIAQTQTGVIVQHPLGPSFAQTQSGVYVPPPPGPSFAQPQQGPSFVPSSQPLPPPSGVHPVTYTTSGNFYSSQPQESSFAPPQQGVPLPTSVNYPSSRGGRFG